MIGGLRPQPHADTSHGAEKSEAAVRTVVLFDVRTLEQEGCGPFFWF